MKFVIDLDKELASGIINNLDGHKFIPVYSHLTTERIPIGKAIIKKDEHKNIVADIELDPDSKGTKMIIDNLKAFNCGMGGVVIPGKSRNIIDKFKLIEISIYPKRSNQ